MKTSWSGSSVRAVSLSSVAKCPDSGATSSTRGCSGRSRARLKCSRVPKGYARRPPRSPPPPRRPPYRYRCRKPAGGASAASATTSTAAAACAAGAAATARRTPFRPGPRLRQHAQRPHDVRVELVGLIEHRSPLRFATSAGNLRATQPAGRVAQALRGTRHNHGEDAPHAARPNLTISSKNYCPWSLRGWLMARSPDSTSWRRWSRRTTPRPQGAPAALAVDPGALPAPQTACKSGTRWRSASTCTRSSRRPACCRPTRRARALPLDLRRDAFRLLDLRSSLPMNMKAPFPASRSGRARRPTSSAWRRSGGNASAATAARTCSARAAWRTPCTRRSSPGSSPTT